MGTHERLTPAAAQFKAEQGAEELLELLLEVNTKYPGDEETPETDTQATRDYFVSVILRRLYMRGSVVPPDMDEIDGY